MSQQYTMKIQEYHEKRAKYDPIAWSKCNICKEKYPNDEIVSHIHQKHLEKDCSTFSCWTCGIKFRKEAQMKRHMKTVKHELEAKKFIIPDEEPVDDEVHLVLIDQATDLSQLQLQLNPVDLNTNVQPLNSSEIPPNNVTPQASTNKEIPLIETYPNPDEHIEEGNQVILNDQTRIFEEIDRMNPKDRAKDIQLDNVVNNLLEALDEGPSTKEEIIGYINQEDDVVDLEIDDWLTMDSWGNTPAVEEMIPIEFENL